jgi:hypothetical protein
MRGHLILSNMIMVVAITSQSSFGAAHVSDTVHTAIPETRSVQTLDHSLDVGISLRTPTDSTITFKPDEDIRENDPPTRRIPHLVLKRNGVLTPGFERTLLVSVNHLSIPGAGLFLDLTIETQHGDPDLDGEKSKKIEIWHETRFVPYSSEPVQAVDFKIIFNQAAQREGRTIQTPTDYYAYRLSLINAQGEKLQEINGDYAFLLENQWRVPFPKVLEDSPGAAPDHLILYYYDMIPFQENMGDPRTRLNRYEVERYIQTELIPAMVHAFEMQTDLWGMPWYNEWVSYRADEDPKSLTVALNEYGTWYHGVAPTIGHAQISIRVDGSFREYSNITDGIMSTFHHELFHNQQRNISLHFRHKGNIAGKEEAWKLFTEGTAVLASFVGQPTVQFEPAIQMRAYLKRANSFIGSDDHFIGDLNENYQEIPYNFTIYWRFLYESCGGMKNGIEDPAAGMDVIRHTLETLYSGEAVDIHSSTDVLQSLPGILDIALQATPTCPFHTYEESLMHFAHAIYLLRLEDGRCSASNDSTDCGFYDPDKLYQTPPAEDHLIHADSTAQINGSIATSYGIDLIELDFDPSMKGKTLKLIFQSISDPENEFNVEIWEIKKLKNGSEVESYSAQIDQPESMRTEDGSLTIEVGSLSVDDVNSLGLIITRIDSDQHMDESGRYLIQAVVE